MDVGKTCLDRGIVKLEHYFIMCVVFLIVYFFFPLQKMIEFEKSASDPRRLFQSSFRLLEEEKWRKSCWPNLVKIEDQLISACLAYEEGMIKSYL
jgi:hypothetical protein